MIFLLIKISRAFLRAKQVGERRLNLYIFTLSFYLFSAKRYSQDVKIIIFIKRKVDVMEPRNLQNITNYMTQNIIAYTLTVEAVTEKSRRVHPVLLPEAFIGSI